MAEQQDAEEKLQQLQLIEQNLQNYMMQKQNVQMQIMEIESALKELEKVDSAYKIVGNIMVMAGKKELVEELTEKKETAGLRIRTLETQEQKLKQKAMKLQEEVLGKIRAEEQ